MFIKTEAELEGMKKASEAVAIALKEMRNYTKPGITTKELDEFGGQILTQYGARSAPRLAYGFPGWTCICLNKEVCHGIPSDLKIIEEGDLINIDVSAELDGFWSDNGGSFVVGADLNKHQRLIDTSKQILHKAIYKIKDGIRIGDIGHHIEMQAKKAGYKVIQNLTGHGIGRSLHEEPHEIANFRDLANFGRFRKNSVVAIETFISTASTIATAGKDGWTMTGNRGGFVAQHEHTIIVTEAEPIILTQMNGIWD